MKTILLTGCTTGIGLATVRGLIHEPNHLILVSRNADKLASLKTELLGSSPDSTIDLFPCDFQDLGSVVTTAKDIASKYAQLDILINNAGIWLNRAKTNQDGFELTWTVNYFAPFLLTHHLMPLLKATAQKSHDTRIINLSSEAYKQGKINFDNFFRYGFQSTYAGTKLADMLWTFRLARDLKDTGITVNCVHPGVIATGLWRELPRPIAWLMNHILPSPIKGAETTLHLVHARELPTGEYYTRSRVQPTKPSARDEALQDRLYDFTRATLAKYLS